MTGTIRQPFRLDRGGIIDRLRPLHFHFNGKPYTGYQGDSLASALLANGVRVLARSFKYHRPRGLFTAGEEEPCALVEIGEGARRVPNNRATLVPLHDGLVASSQNAWPSVDFDLGRLVDYTHRLWPAGFYNKTFKWPGWHRWEQPIRRAAGLGRAPDQPDPDHYEQVNAHCDLLICGGGVAGLIAAQIASSAGLKVILADQSPSLGGALTGEQAELDGRPAADWLAHIGQALSASPLVIVLEHTTVSGLYDHNVTTLLQSGQGDGWRECFWTVRPRHVLLATGAIEQGLIFPHNDRPGIMLASAVRRYLNQYAVTPGRQAVVYTNNDSAYQTVFDLARCQIAVSALVDSRESVSDELRGRLSDLGTRLFCSAHVAGTRGSGALRGVTVESRQGDRLARLPCDLLAVSGGWSPRVHLLAHARGSLRFDAGRQCFVPGELPEGVSVAGSANGTAALGEVIHETALTVRDICRRLGASAVEPQLPHVTGSPRAAETVGAMTPVTGKGRQWIDLAHDVTISDAELAVREGFIPVEHFKRYTTTGMSVDQGKTGNLNAFIVLGALTGRDTGEIGTTTFRPPYMPVSLGAVAAQHTGASYAPRRFLPAHEAHVACHAVFEDYGWQRPDYYPRADESARAAIEREVLAVRHAVGLFDNSPIGKLEVFGPDAATFLERLYLNAVGNLAVGHARYGLMLNESGVIVDDGVFTRLAENRFLVNTTSAGAASIREIMEEWLQCDWPDLEVLVDDVTTQWCNFTLAGPNARAVLSALLEEGRGAFDQDPLGLPHMAACSGTLDGNSARIVRVSFSGETSYEINTASGEAPGLWRRLLDLGAPHGIEPYGVEALMLLRAEKGYLHVGTDTDGTTLPGDVGWGAVALRKASDYVGKRSLRLEAARDEQRRQFVGLESMDGEPLVTGAHVLLGENRRPPAPTDGWVTFAARSPTLQRPIALAMIRAGRHHHGERVTVCEEKRCRQARIVPPTFYDPENLRLVQADD